MSEEIKFKNISNQINKVVEYTFNGRFNVVKYLFDDKEFYPVFAIHLKCNTHQWDYLFILCQHSSYTCLILVNDKEDFDSYFKLSINKVSNSYNIGTEQRFDIMYGYRLVTVLKDLLGIEFVN